MLRGLERQERRIERARSERLPTEVPPRYRVRDHVRQLPLEPEWLRRPRSRLGPIGVFFLRTKKARRLAGLGSRWLGRLLRPGMRLIAMTRDPERAARRTTLRLMAGLTPRPVRDVLWMVRGAHSLGLRAR